MDATAYPESLWKHLFLFVRANRLSLRCSICSNIISQVEEPQHSPDAEFKSQNTVLEVEPKPSPWQESPHLMALVTADTPNMTPADTPNMTPDLKGISIIMSPVMSPAQSPIVYSMSATRTVWPRLTTCCDLALRKRVRLGPHSLYLLTCRFCIFRCGPFLSLLIQGPLC